MQVISKNNGMECAGNKSPRVSWRLPILGGVEDALAVLGTGGSETIESRWQWTQVPTSKLALT